MNPSRVPKSAAPLNTCCITRKMRPKLQPDSSPSMTVHATETEKSRFFANTEVGSASAAAAPNPNVMRRVRS